MKLRTAALLSLLSSAPLAAVLPGDEPTVEAAGQAILNAGAEAALAAVEAARGAVPEYDRAKGGDAAYVEAFMKERETALGALSKSIWDLYELAPTHESVNELLQERWGIQAQVFNEAESTLAEIAGVIEAHPGTELQSTARFWRAYIAVNHRVSENEFHFGFDVAEGHVKDVLAAGEDDVERAGALLRGLGDRAPEGSEQQLALYKRLVEDFGESSSARGLDGKLYQLERVGKPFELAFTDAISGNEVTMAGLAGKVVVVDFWATWCGPCVREMPHMKELYKRFHDQGVEFVGISLDSPPEEGGLDKLKAYVASNEIAWPQYYQGAGWQSEFSSSWKIQGIPALFLVDTKGNLASVNARGRLEELIPELLAQRTE